MKQKQLLLRIYCCGRLTQARSDTHFKTKLNAAFTIPSWKISQDTSKDKSRGHTPTSTATQCKLWYGMELTSRDGKFRCILKYTSCRNGRTCQVSKCRNGRTCQVSRSNYSLYELFSWRTIMRFLPKQFKMFRTVCWSFGYMCNFFTRFLLRNVLWNFRKRWQ